MKLNIKRKYLFPADLRIGDAEFKSKNFMGVMYFWKEFLQFSSNSALKNPYILKIIPTILNKREPIF